MASITRPISSPYIVFHLLLTFRILSAFYNNINDCDETYNYWEPAHYMMHGAGFQTWEYSPLYAIRSYAYILVHVLPLYLVGTANKIVQFYTLRITLALICSLCETYFYKAVKGRLGGKAAILTLFFMVSSSGMFISSTAFLPSSFSMYCTMVAVATWLEGLHQVSVLSIAVSSILAWPFAAVLGVPIAYDIIIRQKRFLFFIIWSLICFLIIAVPVAYIDSHYYGKFVLSWLNIIAYNVFGGGGPDLYGTEPWSFYFINGFLNFNVVFLLALVSWPLIELKGRLQPQSNTGNNVVLLWRFIVLPMVIWMGVFFTRPHKEERFLFPIYPLICLSGAISVSLLQDLLMGVVSHVKLGRGILKLLPALVVLAHGVLGLSRTLALHYNYQAPLQVYTVINSQPVLSFTGYMKEINVCVGKEWHRFPSNYFIPDRIIQPFRGRWHMKFIKSEFKGQLPKPYASGPRATSIIPTHMNDMNKEEPTRYFNINSCHFMIDLELPSSSVSRIEPKYSLDTDTWEILSSYKFLDAKKVDPLIRAFYVPWLSGKRDHYGKYFLLRNKKANFIKDYNDIPK